jgi:hypothetical protein
MLSCVTSCKTDLWHCTVSVAACLSVLTLGLAQGSNSENACRCHTRNSSCSSLRCMSIMSDSDQITSQIRQSGSSVQSALFQVGISSIPMVTTRGLPSHLGQDQLCHYKIHSLQIQQVPVSVVAASVSGTVGPRCTGPSSRWTKEVW